MSAATEHTQRRRKDSSAASSAANEASTDTRSGASGGRLGGAYAMGPALRLAGVQTKLTVGKPGDRFEQEADQVADRVASGKSAPDVSRIPAGGLSTQREPEDESAQSKDEEAQANEPAEMGEQAQAKCAACEGEEGAQTKSENEEGAAQSKGEDERAPAQREEAVEEPPAAQREEETEDSGKETAQTKCVACASDQEGTAQAAFVQREEDPDAEEPDEIDKEEPGEEEPQQGKECKPDSGEGGEEERSSIDPKFNAGPGCGEDSGGGGGGEAAAEEAAAPAGDGCGTAGGHVEAEHPTGGGGGTAEEQQGETGAEETRIPDPPACAEETVPADKEEPKQTPGAKGEGGARHEECQVAQTKEEPEDAAAQAREEAQEESAAEQDSARREAEERSEETAQNEAEESSEATAQSEAEEKSEDTAQTEAEEEQPAQAAEEPDEGAAQREAEEEEAQTRSASPRNRRLQTHAAARLIHARGAGQPLAAPVRERIEATLGVDLEGVRVHTDGNAQAASKALRAKAFTHRNHIFLGPGQSQHDVSLMAHESTHVLQQDAVVRRKPVKEGEPEPQAQSATGAEQRAPERAVERNAPEEKSSTAMPSSEQDAQQPASAASPPPAPEGAVPPPAPSESVAEKPPTEPASKDETSKEQPSKEQPSKEPKRAEGGADAAKPKMPAADNALGAAAKDTAVAATSGDERFQNVMKRLDATSTRERSHAPAKTKMDAARAAVEPPDNERPALADQRHAGIIESKAQSGAPVAPKSFLDILLEKLDKEVDPDNMEETLDLKSSGKVGTLKTAVVGEVATQKKGMVKPLETAARQQPSLVGIPEIKPVGLKPEPAEGRPSPFNAEQVLPEPKPEEEISVEDDKEKADRLMAENDIDEAQLERANEPQFTEALRAKRELDAHTASVPQQYREHEQAHVEGASRELKAEEKQGLSQMRGARKSSKGAVRSKQNSAKKREETERQRVANDIRGLFNAAKGCVDARLEKLDTVIGDMFDNVETAARERFENYVDARMRAYKADRYGGFGGGVLWLKDKIFDLPDEVNDFYVIGRKQYVDDMRQGFVGIAARVASELACARADISKGKADIDDYVNKLEPRLKGYAKETRETIAGDFEALESSVEDKKESLADDLHQRYRESRKDLDERIEELKEANKGLLSRFVAFIKRVVEVLRKLKDLAIKLMKAGGEVLRGIIKDPSGFLGNLIGAVKMGFNGFTERIGEHMQAALIRYISGSVAQMGVAAPAEPGPSGVFGLIMQVLGLTTEKLRAKVVRMVGPRNAERAELAWRAVSGLLANGASGLWERAKDQLGELKERVMNDLRDWFVVQLIKRGVMFILSLFNPVTALLRAIKMIYDVVMFFVENIDRIGQLVDAIIQSISKVVAGNISGAAKWIEHSLGQALTLVISFLARLLGLSGIGDKVRSIVKRIQRPVERVIDKILRGITRAFRGLVRKGKAAAAKGARAVKKFFEWWKIARPFRLGGERHRVFFRGKGKAAQLMIASTPQTLSTYVGTLTGEGVPPAQVNAIKAKAEEIDALKHDAKTEQDIPMTKERGAKIAQAMTQLATLLAAASGNAVVPPSRVQFSTHSDGGDQNAEKMTAAPLSLKPGNTTGSIPTQESKLWRTVSQRPGAYVRGHLLNHHLHGPGDTGNLTPITNSLNQEMERKVETRAKRLVLSDNKVISYEVTAVYGGHAPRKHLAAESRLATSLKFAIRLMNPPKGAAKRDDPSAWSEGKDAGDYSKSLKHELPLDEEVGAVHEEVNLSEDNAAAIAAADVPGLGPARAALIVAGRKQRKGFEQFHSYDQLEELGIPASVVTALKDRPWIKLR